MSDEIPQVQVFVDWERLGMNRIANDGFETNTTGWSVGAGINSAATSIVRTTSAPYIGGGAGRLVTLAVVGSGGNFVLPGSYPSGKAQTFVVALKRISGGTAARITVGSLGTPADRASLSIAALTTTYVRYTVTWTPSAARADAQVTVMTDSAAILTVDLDDAMVYRSINDITDDVICADGATGLTVVRGANFDGSSDAPGTLNAVVLDVEGKYDKNDATSPLFGTLKIGRAIWVRATFDGIVRSLFYGKLTSIALRPGTDLAELTAYDPLGQFSRINVELAASVSRTYQDFRTALLVAGGISATNYSLAGSYEGTSAFTYADAGDLLSHLNAINKATGSIHYIEPSPESSVLWRYITRDRTEVTNPSVLSETWDGLDITSAAGFVDSIDTVVNKIRVKPHPVVTNGQFRSLWHKAALPVTLGPSEALVRLVDESRLKPVQVIDSDEGKETTKRYFLLDPDVEVVATNSPTLTTVIHPRSVNVTVTATASGSDITDLALWALPAVENEVDFVTVTDAASIAEYDQQSGADIDSPYITSEGQAEGVGAFWLWRYAAARARPDLTRVNQFPSQLARQIGDRVGVTSADIAVTNMPMTIMSFTTEVSAGGNLWTTRYHGEELASLGAAALFTVDTSVLNGSNVLAY